jgi:hypothetical protein
VPSSTYATLGVSIADTLYTLPLPLHEHLLISGLLFAAAPMPMPMLLLVVSVCPTLPSTLLLQDMQLLAAALLLAVQSVDSSFIVSSRKSPIFAIAASSAS